MVSILNLTANEKRVTSEYSTIITILEQEADAVLSVAWRMKGLHLDILSNGESLAVAGCRGDLFAVFATNYGKRVTFEHLGVAAGVVMVARYW